MPNYDVRAQLLINARNSYGEVRKLSSEVKALGESIKTTESATRGALSQMVAFGATFLGLRAITGTFVSLTRSAVGYTSELEKTKIGLQSILMAVENTDWETAGRRAGAAFEQLRMMAIKSPATSAEMFDIFNSIVGPVEAAGYSMQKVLDLTNDTVLAASALNEDFPQASRDINMMVRGLAGAHVKLFSMLKATGAIKEDAQAFNALAPEKRVALISGALNKFAKGGAAFGSSWAGVTSTLKDIFDNFKASAFSPIMKTIAANMERFNNYILSNRQSIEAFLTNVGRGLANRIQTVFQKAQMGFEYLVVHWDEIVDRFHQVVKMVREVAPQIAKAAVAWEAVRIGRNVAGAAISAGGGLMSLIGGAGEGGLAALLGRGGGGAAGAATAAGMGMSMGRSPFGMMGASMGAGGAGAASPFGMMGAGATEGASLGAGAAEVGGLAAGFAALLPVMLVIAAVIAAVVAVSMAFADQWKNMLTIFGATSTNTMGMIIAFGKSLWGALSPIFTMLGSLLLVVLVPAWIIFTTLLRELLLVLTAAFDVLGWITSTVWGSVKPAFDFVFGLFRDLAAFINQIFSEYEKWRNATKGPQLGGTEELSTEPTQDYSIWQGNQNQIDLDKAAKGGVNITNDFKGSRISIRQEFKGDQDPDRIVTAMMSDLTRQAENRVSSGYAGALTR